MLVPTTNEVEVGDNIGTQAQPSKGRKVSMSSSEREYIGAQNIGRNAIQEVWSSSSLIFFNRISWLLLLGPIALVGDSTKSFGEAVCFALSGIALIPCAER